MKNSLLFVLVLAAAIPVRAQKVIEKHIQLSASGFVSMNFQISDSIRIITWTKNEVYVKSTIDVNDNKNNDDYKEIFDESGNTVNVTAKLDYHCNTFHTRKRSSDSGNRSADSNNNNDCCCNCGCETTIYHVIYIPENTDFSVETINGNITISGNTAGIRAHSISGYIDLSMSAARQAIFFFHLVLVDLGFSGFCQGRVIGRSSWSGRLISSFDLVHLGTFSLRKEIEKFPIGNYDPGPPPDLTTWARVHSRSRAASKVVTWRGPSSPHTPDTVSRV